MITAVLEGGHILTPQEERFTNLWIENGRIAAISDVVSKYPSQIEHLDVSDCYVTPGLIDLQVNGGPECNLWADPTEKELEELRLALTRSGVTSFLPTLITDELNHLKKNIAFLTRMAVGPEQLRVPNVPYARMPGIHLEGPCLSPQKPGVHPSQWLKTPSRELFEDLITDKVCLVTLAPELEPSGEAVKYLVEKGVRVSLGHSNATFAEAAQAFALGVSLMTHTFNALPPLNHRDPGAICAALRNCLVSCCVICDGRHVDPSMIKLLIRYKGVEQTILVSDAAFIGTSQGGLVGSSIKLSEAVKNVTQWGLVSFREAVTMATFNPAVQMGMVDHIGHLAPHKLADIVVWRRDDLTIKHVILGGKILF